MKVWWCKQHGALRPLDDGGFNRCYEWLVIAGAVDSRLPPRTDCKFVEMQLVPTDALVVVKENGEWPTLLVMELADLLAYTRYDDDPVQYHEARKFLDELSD